jgi:hypothetical protein
MPRACGFSIDEIEKIGPSYSTLGKCLAAGQLRSQAKDSSYSHWRLVTEGARCKSGAEGNMQHTDEALLSVVVLEAGSAWPAWLGEYQKHAPNSVVVAQSAEEKASDFAQRIARRMTEIATSDAAIHAALLVSNGALDEASLAAREQMCASLLRVMVQKRRGELVLAADARAGDALRHELFALAGTLCDELGGTEVNVRVRFGSGRPESSVSGVRKSVIPPPNQDGDDEEPIARSARD